MKYHTLFFSKIWKDFVKVVVCKVAIGALMVKESFLETSLKSVHLWRQAREENPSESGHVVYHIEENVNNTVHLHILLFW